MKTKNPIYKYIIASAVLLAAFLCGYHFRQWHTARYRVQSHICIIYSCGKEETDHKNFEKRLTEEFRARGKEPLLDLFYLDCNHSGPEVASDNIRRYLDIVKSHPADLILVVGDQATFSLLSTRHPLLYSLPVVACNVHFPDEKLIGEYESRQVYVLRDSPDFQRNMEFIKSLQSHAGIEIVYNIDFTPLGRKSFDLLSKSVDRRNVQILGHKSTFSIEYEYEEMRQMTEYYDLMPALSNSRKKRDELVVSLCPFRYIKGTSLLTMMERSKKEQEEKAFLLDKFDLMALPIVNAINVPSFSCIREGFGGDSKIIGGYMASDKLSARAVAELSVRLLNKEKVGMPKIRDIEKEYVINWRSFSAYNEYDIARVPKNTRIVNYPFFDHYRKELYFLWILFVLTFIFISISLLQTRRRAHAERKNLQMLKEAHERLALSANGGQIALWNMQGDDIEFDDNLQRLTGLEKRMFRRGDYLEYVHPDDQQLLGSFYDALLQSPVVQVLRVRFCFSGTGDYQWYELRCRSLKDVKGGMMLAGVLQNIEELVRREHQLIEAKQIAEKAELKQSFLNSVSHQIRTPLNAIVGFTNVLTGEGADALSPEERAGMLEIINENNDLLLKLINDMLEISHLDSSELNFTIQEWDMTQIVREIYETCRPLVRPELQFNLELDETLALPVHTDRIRFMQVVSNFLNNANKFTSAGHITLGCKVDPQRRELCVYVEDTGKGIGEKELMMVFDRFYKADSFEQGNGLGLSICKVIIERLSGRIEVRSELGKGSCFSVVLSYEEAPQDDQKA